MWKAPCFSDPIKFQQEALDVEYTFLVTRYSQFPAGMIPFAVPFFPPTRPGYLWGEPRVQTDHVFCNVIP